MRIIGSSCRRRGISTIIGVIIFVGIMFTAVIPMLLVMNQADTLNEKRKFEVGRLDNERKGEDIHVYVFNKSTSPENLNLRVENWGDFFVTIKRIWINDTSYPLDDFNIPPTNSLEENLTGFTPIPNMRYLVKVTTDRGNVFFEDSGSLDFDEVGNLKAEMFAITFYISVHERGWFDIEIKDDNGTILTDPPFTDPPFSIHKSAVDGTVMDYFSVDFPGTYHVKITLRHAGVFYNDYVTIKWPDGPKEEPVQI